MKWENLNLHIENLLPGIVCTVLILSKFPNGLESIQGIDALKPFLNNSFVLSSIFVAVSYIFGAIAVVLSRFVIDRPSEWFPRPLLLRLLSRGNLNNKCFQDINDTYRSAIKRALEGKNDAVKVEVLKRRERGRMVRTAVFPSVLAALMWPTGLDFPLRIVIAVSAIIIVLFVYAYTETTVYEESTLIIKART